MAKDGTKYYACNESRRIQRLQRFEASGHSKASSLGWTGAGKDHSGRGHATRAHHSLGGTPTSESAASLGRGGSGGGGGRRGNGLSSRFTCDVYRAVWCFRERSLQSVACWPKGTLLLTSRQHRGCLGCLSSRCLSHR